MKKLRRVFHLRSWGPSVRTGVDWEIQHHLDERVDQLMAAGRTRPDAEAEVLRELGDLERLRRELYGIDAGTLRRQRLHDWLGTVRQDVRHAARSMRQHPAFALGIVCTLGIGLGAAVALFAVVDALLLRPLPYRAPHELAVVGTVSTTAKAGPPGAPVVMTRIARGEAQSFREASTFLTSTMLHARRRLLFTGGLQARHVTGHAVTPEFEELLGAGPIVGRGFLPGDAAAGAPPVVLIDYRFWRSEFAADPNVPGRTLVLEGIPHVVIGVMPKRFKFPEYASTDLWLPLPEDGTLLGQPAGMTEMLARVPGGDFALANARADVLSRALHAGAERNQDRTFRLERFGANRVPSAALRQSIALLCGAVLLILLVAAVNVTNLLFMRSSVRARELAVRLALGAARARLFRQLATEYLTLALVAGVLAMLVATLTLRAIAGIMPESITFWSPFAIEMESRTLWFTFGISVSIGFLIVLAPALAGSRFAGTAGAALTRHAARTKGRVRLRASLAVCQVALSLTLLVLAGLLLNSFTRLMRVDPGMRLDELALLQITVPSAAYPEGTARAAFMASLEQRLEALPGVLGVTRSAGLPPRGAGLMIGETPQPEGGQPLTSSGMTLLPHTSVAPDFFQVTGARLLAGRAFASSDRSNPSVIIDEDLAAALWPGSQAVGRRFRAGQGEWWTVVGVLADLKLLGPDDRRSDYELLFPLDPESGYGTFAVRTAGDPRQVLPAIRAVVRELDRNQPIEQLTTARAAYAVALDMPRFLLTIMVVLAALAVALAAIGIHSVLSYGIGQRTHELSVRLAVGARSVDIGRSVLGQGIGLTVLGIATGLIIALLTTRYIRSTLFGVEPADPVTFGAVSLLLLVIALVACARPARRAARIDPAGILHQD